MPDNCKGERIKVAADIAKKLRNRGNHLLKKADSPDSPLILVSAELKINADEIEEAYNV